MLLQTTKHYRRDTSRVSHPGKVSAMINNSKKSINERRDIPKNLQKIGHPNKLNSTTKIHQGFGSEFQRYYSRCNITF